MDELEPYNVVWDSPGKGPAGSMPIGNGEIGLNVWVEEEGDIVFYISRTDAWSEACRLLKLGRIRVSLSPNPFVKGAPFRQELRLRDGCIEMTAGKGGATLKLKVFVDAAAPVIHVIGESARPLVAKAALETWRKERKTLVGEELQSSWTMQEAPTGVEVWESADVVSNAAAEAVVWFHRNEHSIVPLTLKHQSLDSVSSLVKDPLLHRTFGGCITAQGFVKDNHNALISPGPVERFAIQIATHSAQTETSEAWEAELDRIAAGAATSEVAAKNTAAWWDAFWNRSWIFVQGDQAAPLPENNPPLRIGADSNDGEVAKASSDGSEGHCPSLVTRAYLLQRWMAACGGRGNYPIKFNGSLFTVDPEFTGGPKFDADWRRWGDCYWWQNTRLPYFPMLVSGDFEQLGPLFALFRHVLPLCKARAKLYYNAEGAYFPETMTLFGTYANRDYGWNRHGLKPGDVQCPYWCFSWQQGLELLMLMLDFWDYTGDERFVADEIIPMANEVLRYFDSRFSRDKDGKIILSPTQAVETYWFDVVNDTPTVAGLHAVLDRLVTFRSEQAPTAAREFWRRMKDAAPPLPVRTEDGKRFVPPAAEFNPQRKNVENPELYAIWPFRIFGVGQPDLQTGIETYHRRIARGLTGWCYDGQCAAILGLADEAKNQILAKVRNSHPNHRFPAMWGPNFDWLPDQDHGSNILLTLQHMLLRAEGQKIFLFPAWPKEWNVRFRLHATRKTVVECEYRRGKIARLEVMPRERAKDVVILGHAAC